MSIARWTASWMLMTVVMLVTAAAPAAADTNALGWGSNFAGLLGDGSTAESATAASASTPVPVVAGAIPAGVSIVSLAAGSRFTVALGSDGKAYSWGRNCDGELGIGTADACAWPPVRHAAPEAVAMPPGVQVVDVAAGLDHGVAVGSDGKLYSWGQNCSGQLGIGSVDTCEGGVGPAHPTPVASVAGDIPSGVKIVSADATQSATVALGSDGKVYALGYVASSPPDGRPHAATGDLPAGVTITQVAAGRNRMIVLGSDGEVYTLSTSYRPPLLFAAARGAIPETVEIVRISAGYSTLYAVGDDGEVYAWGSGGQGQLGNGGTADAPAPVKVDDSGALSGVDVVDVAAAEYAAAALGSDGKVYTWGAAYYGQLGNATDSGMSTVPVTAALPAGSRASVLASGSVASGFFALSLSRLTVTKTGSGSGKVSDSATPRRIDCGTTCSALFGTAEQVTLTATPAPESTFTGWTGACSGRTTCTVTTDQARSVTATFAAGNPLVISKSGSGDGRVTDDMGQIDCGASCFGAFPTWGPLGTRGPVTRVRLLATPAAGSTFSHWEGACAAYGADCELHMSVAQETTAVFRARRTLSVSKSGSGEGLVRDISSYVLDCGPTCSGTYDEATVVTLQAYGIVGAKFDGWGGACSGTGTCTVMMSEARNVTATFTAPAPYVPPTQHQTPQQQPTQQQPTQQRPTPQPLMPTWFPPPASALVPPSSGGTARGTATKPAAQKKPKRCYKRKGKKRVRVACKRPTKKTRKKRSR